MQPTNEQIERVAKWCRTHSLHGFHLRVNALWYSGLTASAGSAAISRWDVVGIIAESAKAAGIWFKTPAWFSGYQEWWSVASEPRPNGKSCIGKSNDPAFAAILAVDAYLVAKGADDAR